MEHRGLRAAGLDTGPVRVRVCPAAVSDAGFRHSFESPLSHRWVLAGLQPSLCIAFQPRANRPPCPVSGLTTPTQGRAPAWARPRRPDPSPLMSTPPLTGPARSSRGPSRRSSAAGIRLCRKPTPLAHAARDLSSGSLGPSFSRAPTAFGPAP